MVAQITDLPYLCVRNILTYLPVIDIIYIDRVLPEWTSMQRDYLRKRTHLTLLLGNENPMRLIRSSSLNIPYGDEFVEGNGCKPYRIIEINGNQIAKGHLEQLKLSQLMPSVEHLEVAMCGVYWWSLNYSIVPLIKLWADQLITFKFRYNRSMDPDSSQICLISKERLSSKLLSLFECINTRMMRLQCLHIDVFDFYCFLEYFKGQTDLSILRQLREFRFHSNDNPRMLFDQLLRYATDRLRTIAIGNIGPWEDLLTQFGESTFAKSFVIFSKYGIPNEFCTSCLTTFDSLRSVRLRLADCDKTTLPQLTRYLSPLRNLVHLDLNIRVDVSRFDRISDEHIYPLSAQIVTLRSPSIYLHNALKSRHWPRMFPACRILVVTVRECTECKWYGTDCDGEFLRLEDNFEECRKCLLAPFKALPNLCKIYLNTTFCQKTILLTPDQL